MLAALRSDPTASLSETERSQLHASVWAQRRSPTTSPASSPSSPASSRLATALPAWRRLAYAGAAAVLALAVGGSLLPHVSSPSYLDSATLNESDSSFSTPRPGDVGASNPEFSTFSTPPAPIDGLAPDPGTGLDTTCLPSEPAHPPASTPDATTSPPPPPNEALPPRSSTTDSADLPTTDPLPDTPPADTTDHGASERETLVQENSADNAGGVSCVGEVAPSPVDVPPLPEPGTGGGVDGALPTLPHPAER